MTTKVSAIDNPNLANQIVDEALGRVEKEAAKPRVKIDTPPDTMVELCAGIQDPFNGLITNAEVRELNGADEEAIAKAADTGKALLTILERATVKLGGKPADSETLDMMLSGDRELLLLTIRRVTFGDEITFEGNLCSKCTDTQKITVDLNKDVPLRKLEGDRTFTVKGKSGVFELMLPNGSVQKQLVNSANKTTAELDTLVLKGCVKSINGNPVIDADSVRQLPIKDRRDILKAISDRNPGPQLNDVTKSCPNCGSEVPLPLTLADLFQE